MNNFVSALNSSDLIITAEFLPPRGADPEAVKKLASALPSDLDAIIIADNPDEVRASAFSAARILSLEGRSGVVVSMATRDRNRIALISDAMGAAALGIPAVVCMSGNHQSLGISSQAASANDLDSVQFIQALKKIVLHNLGMNGDQLKGALNLQVGATTHPFMRPLEMGIMRLKKKVIAGADFLLTQAVFNFEQFAEWMDAVRAAGLDNRTAIIASVLILDSAGKARELQRTGTYGPIPDSVIQRIENSADQAKEGIAIASEAALRLKGMPGVRGIHIICGGCEGFAAEVIHQAGLNKQGAQTFSDHIN